MIEVFKSLREKSKTHSYKDTIEILKKNNLIEKFDIDKEPIASGVFG
jgi:hypothetical protein